MRDIHEKTYSRVLSVSEEKEMHRFKSVNENIVKTFDTILRKIAKYRLIIESFLSI